MKRSNGVLADAYAAWLSSVAQCCAPLTACLHGRPGSGFINETPKSAIQNEQPSPVPAPCAGMGVDAHAWAARGPERGPEREREAAPRKSFASVRTSFSVRSRFRSKEQPRRLQISAPTNFRHLESESFQFPQYTHLETVPRPRPSSFRPLELSLHRRSQSSPILPHFGVDGDFDILPPPPPAKVRDGYGNHGYTLAHERSNSSMSFHLPRRPVDSPSLAHKELPPQIPPKSRARAYTTPDVEEMKVRIASAMLEVEKLQEQIDSVIERQSIYAASSRPSTMHSMVSPSLDFTPMPSIPALPPVAPSFSERLNPGIERPRTAPARNNFQVPHSSGNVMDASTGFITPPPSRGAEEVPLAPPLPLVLRPPLRKKKSFSRVSTWLFPAPEHNRDNSENSAITSLPRPITGQDGFYQCIAPTGSRRASSDTVSTLSTWATEDEERTVPTTTWSPGSSPATKTDEPTLERLAGLGGLATGPRRESVGVAF